MKSFGIAAAFMALLFHVPDSRAEPLPTGPKVGKEFEISKCYETSNQTSGESSSGSSRGCNTILERAIVAREDGQEFEYDLPRNATDEDRAREWMFPARVLRQADGSLQLLNKDELEARLESWLDRAKWTREVCGRWIFT